ncbi:MAG: hypothetical protein KGL74_10910 [Elusimicrobia bacterium]|nr:hypothetical protein [Elusimicrobiota bacterium]MDE2511620.1 hypothetical protein [Elusimicrobiota bacterium]
MIDRSDEILSQITGTEEGFTGLTHVAGRQSENIIGSASIRYGLEQLSKKKCVTYLQAEFPHFWPNIKKFVKGKTEYSPESIRRLLGKSSDKIISDLIDIGFLSESRSRKGVSYKIPFVYRDGLELSQGKQIA